MSNLLHLWTCVISRMRSWNPGTKCTQDESCSEVTLRKTTLVHVQCSLNKVRLRPKRQQRESWLSSQDSPVVQGQAADAVSAYTPVEMEDAPKLLIIPTPQSPDIWMRLPRHKWPKSWSNIEDPVVSLERNLYGHPPAGLLWEGQLEEVPSRHVDGTRYRNVCASSAMSILVSEMFYAPEIHVRRHSMQKKSQRRKRSEHLYSQSQMELQNCLGEIVKSENHFHVRINL